MSDLLTDAAGWLSEVRRTSLSQSVTYSRGESSVQLQATPGRTEYEIADEYGTTVKAHVTDWIVDAADLVLDGQRVLPEPGDRITTADGRTFEVLPLAGEHYRFLDPAGTMLRIHTRRID